MSALGEFIFPPRKRRGNGQLGSLPVYRRGGISAQSLWEAWASRSRSNMLARVNVESRGRSCRLPPREHRSCSSERMAPPHPRKSVAFGTQQQYRALAPAPRPASQSAASNAPVSAHSSVHGNEHNRPSAAGVPVLPRSRCNTFHASHIRCGEQAVAVIEPTGLRFARRRG